MTFRGNGLITVALQKVYVKKTDSVHSFGGHFEVVSKAHKTRILVAFSSFVRDANVPLTLDALLFENKGHWKFSKKKKKDA